jgi:hypothetical protein
MINGETMGYRKVYKVFENGRYMGEKIVEERCVGGEDSCPPAKPYNHNPVLSKEDLERKQQIEKFMKMHNIKICEEKYVYHRYGYIDKIKTLLKGTYLFLRQQFY